MLRKTLVSLFAFSMLSTASLGFAAEELTFQSLYPPAQTANTEILVPWTESFGKNSNGEYQVHFFPSSAVVAGPEVSHAVKSGMLDMGIWSPSSFPKESPTAFMFNLPFMSKNARHGTEVIWHLYENDPELKKDIDDKGEMLAMWSTAAISIASVNAPITSPADLKGKRVLILAAADSTFIEAWGGIPVYVPASDAYIGLQRGMGEALFTAVPFQRGLRIMEIAKYLTVLPCSANLFALSVNKDIMEDIPEEFRTALRESTGKELSVKIAANLDDDVELTKKLFQDAGAQIVELTPEQYTAFVDSTQDLKNTYWLKTFTDYGIKGDVKAKINAMLELSDSIPDPNLQ